MSTRKKFYLMLIVFSVLLLLILKDHIKYGVIKKVPLEFGSDDYDRWAESPHPLSFKVYLFHVQNPEEVTFNGAKPKVKEVGPYVYRYYRRKEKIEYIIEDDALRYKELHFFDFNPEASAPLSDNDVVTVLNVPLQSVIQHVENTKEEMLSNLNVEWNDAFKDTTNLFLNITVKDLLFEGYRFCIPRNSQEEFQNYFCEIARNMTNDSKFFLLEEDGSVLFAFFAYKNYNDDGQYEISAGLKDINELGRIQLWNDEEYLTTWRGYKTSCNKIRGTDSFIFPPFRRKTHSLEVYNTDICRVVDLLHVGEEKFKGLMSEVFGSTFVILKPEQFECYCIKQTRDLTGEFNCLPDGFADMSSCLGIPIVVSHPHLLWANENYRRTVMGLSPSESKHATNLLIEPRTGFLFRSNKRIQYNMFIRPIQQMYIASGVTPSVVPLLWFDEFTEITDDLIHQLKTEYLKHEDF